MSENHVDFIFHTYPFCMSCADVHVVYNYILHFIRYWILIFT